MTTCARWGKHLIAAAALSTLLVPIGVDGWAFRQAHMGNPLWPPHAKLHCAMSFFGAVGLAVAALLLLRRPAADRAAMLAVAWCATVFWAGLIAAGFWPGTSYHFAGDLANCAAPPIVLGVPLDLNVACAVATIFAGWTGFALVAAGSTRSSASP